MGLTRAAGGVAAVLALVAALVVAGCDRGSGGGGGGGGAGRGPADPQQKAALTVVTTTGMIADIARNIAGERARVSALMGEGVDPHLYKPSPGDVRMLSDADLVLYNGLHLEGRMGEVLENLGKRKAVVPVAGGIAPDRLRSPPEFKGQHDPHVWFDVSLWIVAAEATREALIKADPDGAMMFRANAERYLAQLGSLHEEVRTAIASIPIERRVLVTAHDAFGYFGRAYGIEVLAIQGISTDSEAGLKDINHLVDVIVERNIPAVFIESSVPRKTIDALIEGAKGKGHAVRVGGELFSDAMGAAGTPEGTYTGMVRHNVKVIVEGLK